MQSQLLSMESVENQSVCKEAVFDQIFQEHAETLRNFCYYKSGNLNEAEDLVQEAYIRLWKNCAKVPYAKAKSFLYKVAQNLFLHQVEHKKVVLKFLRRQHRKQNLESPEFLQEEKEFLKRLEEAISSLSEKQRLVFLLNRINGKSYREIADMLGISVKSVEKRMHRALLSLRKLSPQI
ncbi:MAG: RNA polymerase sigma factor [Bacteroidota bacterium]